MQSTHLPASWVESLFGKLAALYGDQFLRKWEHVPKADLLQTWAEGLGPYADDGEHRGQRLKWALAQLRDNNPFPPSLPEFIALVRQAPRPEVPALPAPKVSPEVAHQRAEEMAQAVRKIAAKQVDGLAWARRADLAPKIPGSAWESHLIAFARDDERGMEILREHVENGIRFSERVYVLLNPEAADA